MSDICVLCTTIKRHILKIFSKEMVLTLLTIKIKKILAIKMFKVFKGIIPQIVKKVFQFRDAMQCNENKIKRNKMT